MKHRYPTLQRTILAACMVLGSMAQAHAQQLSNQSFQTNVNIDVMPVAELTIIGSNLLYLEIPPGDSTVPSSGVEFVVTGNANATLIAEPDDSIEVAGEGFMGKAVLNAGEVGYKLELRFPKTGSPGSPVQIAALPGFEEGPTVPPLTVNLMATGGQRTGVLHMEAHPNWTPDGGIPLPGVYVGQVVLTLTAD